jgi:acetyl/propionyl-CoA carboxylase alpha subunit
MKTVTVTLDRKRYAISLSDHNQWSVEGYPGEASVRETEPGVCTVMMNGRSYRVVAGKESGGWLVLLGGLQRAVTVESERARLLKQYTRSESQAHRHLEIRAPMPALVGRILVSPGETVRPSQALLVLEAMKMENEIKAHQAGTVKEVRVERGQTVEKGALLLVLD